MLDLSCPECGNAVRPSGSQLSRLPGEEWQTHVDYACADAQCAGRLRVTVPRRARHGSAADVDAVQD